METINLIIKVTNIIFMTSLNKYLKSLPAYIFFYGHFIILKRLINTLKSQTHFLKQQ